MYKKLITIIVIIIGLIFLYYNYTQKKIFEFDVVSIHPEYVEKIKSSGAIAEKNDIFLSFQNSGLISSISYKEGSKNIKTGEILAQLDTQNLTLDLEIAKLKLAKENSILDRLTEGTTKEEQNISLSNVSSAKILLNTSYSNAHAATKHTIEDIKISISKNIDKHFSNVLTSPSLSLALSQDKKTFLESGRKKINTLFFVKNELYTQTNNKNIKSFLTNTLDNLNYLEGYVAFFINSLYNPTHLNVKSDLENLNRDIASSKQFINHEISKVLISTHDIEKSLYEHINILSTVQQSTIKEQIANINIAKIEINKINLLLKQSIIIAPFDGRVAEVLVAEKENVNSNISVIRFVSNGRFEIKTIVSELDILDIATGEYIEFNVDALDHKYRGLVTDIAYTETFIGNTPTYVVTIDVISKEKRLKPGMSVTVEFIKNIYKNTLVVSVDAIKYKSKKSYVLLIQGNKQISKEVKIGAYFPSGNVEIISGINENDKVVIHKK